MKPLKLLTATLIWALAPPTGADPRVVATEYLGSFTGHEAALHPDNQAPQPIAYYGTDLGFSYRHQDRIHFLFGDTWATEAYAPIEASTGARFDDGFGTIDIEDWPDPAAIGAGNMPTIRLGQNAGTTEMAAMNPGHAMDLGKTPMAGFSSGGEEFAIFNVTKVQGCADDAGCGNGLSCDTGLGYLGVPFDTEEGLTLPCVDGQPACVADTLTAADGSPVAGSGLCVDRGSSIWADTEAGRMAAAGIMQRVARRSTDDPRSYPDVRRWLTNRFLNVTATTVQRFDPLRAMDPGAQDYAPATGSSGRQRVFLWGRPGFVGVKANGRSLGLYFGWVDMPRGPDFGWRVHYFTGLVDGKPRFSLDESRAAPLDLDSGQAGVQAEEVHDITHQMSVEWVAPLQKWVMFYGGGITRLPSPPLPNCGVLELFARSECSAVEVGDGAIRMRTADHPWGPWSPPQDVIAGGDPDVPGSGQYGPGGALNHPACTGEGCAPHTNTPFYHDDEYGFFYSANIIAEWTVETEDGVALLWNASTWDPYRVVLLRTFIAR